MNRRTDIKGTSTASTETKGQPRKTDRPLTDNRTAAAAAAAAKKGASAVPAVLRAATMLASPISSRAPRATRESLLAKDPSDDPVLSKSRMTTTRRTEASGSGVEDRAKVGSPVLQMQKRKTAVSWSGDADRRIEKAGSGVQVRRVNSDEGWMSSRRQEKIVEDTVTESARKVSGRQMARSKAVPVGSDKVSHSNSKGEGKRRAGVGPSNGKAKVSLKRGREVVTMRNDGKKRADDIEAEHDSSTMRPPKKKPKGVGRGKEAPPKDSLSSSRHCKKSGAEGCSSPGDCSSPGCSAASADVPFPSISAARSNPRHRAQASDPTSSSRKLREHGQQHAPRHVTDKHRASTVTARGPTQATPSSKGRVRRAREMAGAAQASVSKQHAAPTHGLDRFQSPSSSTSSTFLGLSFVITGFLDEVTVREVERTVLEGGGRLQEDMPSPRSQSRRGERSSQDNDDVVVAVSHPAASREPGYMLALSAGTPLVHHLWISDSVAQGRALPAAPYLLPGVRESSKRRQAEAARAAARVVTPDAIALHKQGRAGCPNGIGHARGDSDAAAAASRAAIATARAAVSQVVAKPGTPLNGMSVGIAHGRQEMCSAWAKVLRCAGAQTVREIFPVVPSDDDDDDADGEKLGAALLAGQETASVAGINRGGITRGDDAMQALLAGLDCVLCDYPDTWYDKPGALRRLTDGANSRASPTGLGRLPWRTPSPASRLSSCGRKTQATSAKSRYGPHGDESGEMPFLYRMLESARLGGVQVVSLSWAIDCVLRGARIKWQSSPEYLLPFAELSFTPKAVSLTGISGRTSRGGAISSPLASSNRQDTSLLAFISRGGIRYEVSDHVRFEDDCRIIESTTAATSGEDKSSHTKKGKATYNRQGSFKDKRKEEASSGLGRIVSLSRASNGTVVVVLEPVQAYAGAYRMTSGARMLACGVPVVVAGPSMHSSVGRGRGRRANELLTTVTGGGVGRGGAASRRLKVEGASLRGKITLVKPHEYDNRRGYCGRDPDVYVRRATSVSKVK